MGARDGSNVGMYVVGEKLGSSVVRASVGWSDGLDVDGEIVGRTKVASSGARADMIARGNRLFVYTNDGTLKAYDVEARN